MGAPQIIWIVLAGISVGTAISQHGARAGGTHNAWVAIASVAVSAALLFWGGFFS